MHKKLMIVAGLVVMIALLFNFRPVLAHEAITVGDYTLEVGWLSEPPVVGQQNAIFVQVTKTSDSQPVEDVSAMTVSISYGGQEKTLTLQPLGEDTPGQFVAPILPTIPGLYTLKLGGTLDGTTVNAEVEPEEVQPADTLQFPSLSSAQQDSGQMNWLVYLSLLIGLVALGLAVAALRKAR